MTEAEGGTILGLAMAILAVVCLLWRRNLRALPKDVRHPAQPDADNEVRIREREADAIAAVDDHAHEVAADLTAADSEADRRERLKAALAARQRARRDGTP